MDKRPLSNKSLGTRSCGSGFRNLQFNVAYGSVSPKNVLAPIPLRIVMISGNSGWLISFRSGPFWTIWA